MRHWWIIFLLGCNGVEIGNPSEPPKVQGQFQVMLAETENIQYGITIHEDGTVSAERSIDQVSEDAASASCIENSTQVIVEAIFVDGEVFILTFQLNDADAVESATVAIDEEFMEFSITDVDSGITYESAVTQP